MSKMATRSRLKDHDLLLFVLTDIVGEDPSKSYVMNSIEYHKFDTLEDLFSLPASYVDTMVIKEADASTSPLPAGYGSRLKALKAYNTYLIDQTGLPVIDYQDNNVVRKIKFQEYRLSGLYNPDFPPQPRPKPSSSPAHTFAAKTAAAEFKRGTKRDKAH